MGKSFLTAAIVDALGAMGKRVALTASTGVAGVQARTYLNLTPNLKPKAMKGKRVALTASTGVAGIQAHAHSIPKPKSKAVDEAAHIAHARTLTCQMRLRRQTHRAEHITSYLEAA